jgi:cytochrome c oxidase cbb3-type subunit 3
VFIVTIIWSIGYFVVYPSWPVPGGHLKGILGYTQAKELAQSQAEIVARQAAYLDRFSGASFQQIMDDPELYAFANAGGSTAFKNNCATCHGNGAQGAKGYPNLNDDDWLWGGKVSDIYQTLKFGIRSGHEEARFSQMPAFGRDNLLKRDDIYDVVDYVMTLSGGKPAKNHEKGMEIFKSQCTSCHGTDGKGNRDFGAPNLTDKIWLYGGDRATIFETVYNSRAGVMPAWGQRLDDNTLRELTIYIHQLGGGEAETSQAVPEVQQPTQTPETQPTGP